MIALLAAAALGGTAVDAERAFARDAQRLGQWASFRKWSDHDAVMFVPQTVWAREFTAGRKEPVKAIAWSLNDSITSCDGTVAVNIGPWNVPGRKGQGLFTTIWLKKPNGWHWIYDGGQVLAQPVAARATPLVRRASCKGKPTGAPIAPAPPPIPETTTAGTPSDQGRGESGDRTLGWDWKVGKAGDRVLRVFQWTGKGYAKVVDQHIPAQ